MLYPTRTDSRLSRTELYDDSPNPKIGIVSAACACAKEHKLGRKNFTYGVISKTTPPSSPEFRHWSLCCCRDCPLRRGSHCRPAPPRSVVPPVKSCGGIEASPNLSRKVLTGQPENRRQQAGSIAAWVRVCGVLNGVPKLTNEVTLGDLW